jgi:hypothetical protein
LGKVSDMHIHRYDESKFFHYNSYSSPDIIGMINQVKEDEMDRACSTIGGKRSAYRILVGKPEGKRSLGGPRHRRWTILKWVSER